ncbi:hypothetical protein QBC46DRAFT_438468 [Diplogelasinospora grovesii]|uniref:BZIP domain-containing protein n=1 Tax=Diplogelasinospora grovesii TaxID=303347 RepID=A0AAN6N6H7_9PEZI|nr:hypothetical protein QBC46DRAFT_438468 [Diplogelasinospora grovesii]
MSVPGFYPLHLFGVTTSSDCPHSGLTPSGSSLSSSSMAGSSSLAPLFDNGGPFGPRLSDAADPIPGVTAINMSELRRGHQSTVSNDPNNLVLQSPYHLPLSSSSSSCQWAPPTPPPPPLSDDPASRWWHAARDGVLTPQTTAALSDLATTSGSSVTTGSPDTTYITTPIFAKASAATTTATLTTCHNPFLADHSAGITQGGVMAVAGFGVADVHQQEQQPQKKRGRGRPRLSNPDISTQPKRGRPRMTTTEAETAAKKKRGRPRIDPSQSSNADLSASKSDTIIVSSNTENASESTNTGTRPPDSVDDDDAPHDTSTPAYKPSSPISRVDDPNEEEGHWDGRDNKDTSKKTDLLARNRVAASRYRAKTQAAFARLEADEREASQRREVLLACATQLRNEVLILKTELLKHAGCECPLIQRYLSRAAQQVCAGLRNTSSNSGGGSGSGTEEDEQELMEQEQDRRDSINQNFVLSTFGRSQPALAGI